MVRGPKMINPQEARLFCYKKIRVDLCKPYGVPAEHKPGAPRKQVDH